VRLGPVRGLLPALVLLAPALGLAQETNTPSSSAPAAGAPAAGAPAAELPGAGLPGTILPTPGLTGAGATGLSPMPAEYTSYGVSAGVGATDNVKLSATDPKSQGLAATNLFFDLIRSGSRLDLNALGNFSDIDYLENAYSNQVLGRFDGLANLTLWQHHFTWLVRDDYGDQQINPLQSLNPTNLQRVNVFATGPSLALQPTLSSFIELQGLYGRNTWQDSPFSGNTESGTATVGHEFTPASSLSLVGQIEQERFDETTLNVDYQIRNYYGHYDVRGARTAIDLQGGVSQANDTGAFKSSPLVRFLLSRNVSPFSLVSLSGGRYYSSPMGSFASLATGVGGGIPIGAAAQTSGSILKTYGDASWGFHRARTTIELRGGWERDAYDRQSTFNVDRDDVSLSLGRQLTQRLSANIMAGADRSRYSNQGFTNSYGTAAAGLVYRLSAQAVLYGRYDHQFQRSSGLTRGLGYDANRIFIMIGYYPHASGSGMRGMPGMGGIFLHAPSGILREHGPAACPKPRFCPKLQWKRRKAQTPNLCRTLLIRKRSRRCPRAVPPRRPRAPAGRSRATSSHPPARLSRSSPGARSAHASGVFSCRWGSRGRRRSSWASSRCSTPTGARTSTRSSSAGSPPAGGSPSC